MVSGIFIFNFYLFFFDFNQNMMEMMPILPIYSSTFGQMKGIDGVPPPPIYLTTKFLVTTLVETIVEHVYHDSLLRYGDPVVHH